MLPTGIHYDAGVDQEIEWAKAGGNLIVHSSDGRAFQQQLSRELQSIREALGDL